MFFMIRTVGIVKQSCPSVYSKLCKHSMKNNLSKIQVATLTRAAFRNPDDIPDIRVFPYHYRVCTWYNLLLDSWQNRVHKESKIIVVDGAVASGKEKLAKQLAQELDFLYLRQPNFDDLYVDWYGFDHRTLDPVIPESCRTTDIERFLKDPNGNHVCAMQHYMLFLRFNQYMAALRHILATGQGVVTVRSPWSDTVFAKSMYENGFISKEGYWAHQDSMEACEHYFLKPHLIIYLDTPVDVVLQNIKKRNIPYEVNSKAMTEKYLSSIEENYRSQYLNIMNQHSLLLIYDWSKGGDFDIILEDIESLNFDNLPEQDKRLKDWNFTYFLHKLYLQQYTLNAWETLRNLDLSRTDVPEMLISGNDIYEYDIQVNKLPHFKYSKGYHPEKDKNLYFKWQTELFTDYVTPLLEKRKAAAYAAAQAAV